MKFEKIMDYYTGIVILILVLVTALCASFIAIDRGEKNLDCAVTVCSLEICTQNHLRYC